MPPKKPKDLAEAPVYRMRHEEQVQLLSDALLREYMHRRGFRATLKAFDDEHPRDDSTISSRAVMSDLMALRPEDQQRLKADGIETIMEMLCFLRVERRREAERLAAEAAAPLPRVPAKYEELEAKLAERAMRSAKKEKRGKKKRSSTKASASGSAGEHDDETGGHRRGPKAKARPPRDGPAGDEPAAGMTIDDLLASSQSSSSSSLQSGGDDSDGEMTRRAGQHRGASPSSAIEPQKQAVASQAEDRGAQLPSSAAAPVRPAWMEIAQHSKKAKAEEDRASSSGSDDGDEEEDGDGVDGGSDASTELGAAPLPAALRDELSAAFQLLCGFDGSLPRAMVEQGFTFDEDMDCALIQWRRSACDAVLAPVQAFVAAYFYEREVYVKKQQRQRDCLLRALCTMLEQAQPNPAKMVVVDAPWELKAGGAARLTRAAMRQQADGARARCWTGLGSMEDLKAVLRDTLLRDDRWMKPRGSGLLSFLFSLLLSHGVDAVQRELANAATTTTSSSSSSGGGGAGGDGVQLPPTLLAASAEDRATLALANLALTGKATSYCHNGMQRGNQLGYAARLRCGMLSGDDTAAAREEGDGPPVTYATEPVMPSWVVCHKGHYANLYMPKDTRQVFQQKLSLGGSASEDVVYWDAATEDDAYTLTVTVRSLTLGGGGGGARNARSFVNTAITSVAVWSSAEVNWNGEAPLRD